MALGIGEVLPSNYIPLDDFHGYEIVSMQYRILTPANSSTTYPAFNILFKDESGNLYLEEFGTLHVILGRMDIIWRFPM